MLPMNSGLYMKRRMEKMDMPVSKSILIWHTILQELLKRHAGYGRELTVPIFSLKYLPPETLNAYRKHGKPALRLKNHIKRACWVMSELTELGIDIDSITKKLENDGVEKFIKAFDKLMETLEKILINLHVDEKLIIKEAF
jgi:ERCC4-related helicase